MKRRGSFALVVAGALVCVLALFVVPILNLTVYVPGRAALAYFKALEKHDADRAMMFLDAPQPSYGDGISDEVLAGAASVPKQAKVLDSTRVKDKEYDVKVSYVQGSETREITLRLVRGDSGWGTTNAWAIKIEKWPAISIDAGGAPTALLNGTSVEATETPVLFPVTYSVGFNSTYLRSGIETVDVVDPTTTSDVHLTGKPTQELTKKVTEILKKQIDECMKSKTLMPTGCSFGKETNNQILGDVKWKVKSYPAVTLEQGASGIEMAPTNAVFTVSGKQRDAVTAYEYEFTDTVTTRMSAQVHVDGDKVSVTQVQDSLGD